MTYWYYSFMTTPFGKFGNKIAMVAEAEFPIGGISEFTSEQMGMTCIILNFQQISEAQYHEAAEFFDRENKALSPQFPPHLAKLAEEIQ